MCETVSEAIKDEIKKILFPCGMLCMHLKRNPEPKGGT